MKIEHPDVLPDISASDFDAFAALLRDDPSFPRTFSQWLEGAGMAAGTRPATAVAVSFEEFTRYCHYRCSPPRFSLLRRLASAKAPLT